MFRPHKIKWSDHRSKIVPDAKKQPIRHSQMARLIGRGTGEKRAGNSNIVFFIVYKNDCFGQDNDFVWLPGAAL